ncbi:pyrroline-5-carboxylate reductase [Caldilinea sp.]|mgnify:FL=1|uniref:pyrroline-5-carboxylate reductase n=1 Tax=Caldilinea sp. TaxID=2293560 RepID=UPI002BB0CFA0|nr:pyrroline-5-carboxylate reductase [Caldilinea sp.]HRA67539.1 pyrroline-5-carboxylate reductase [Caldilinea sp.]
MLNGTKIAFIGSGVMGEAMIKGLLTQGLTTAAFLSASDPWTERLDYIHTTYSVEVTPDNATAVREAGIVVLSIKPQSLLKVGKDLHSKIHPEALVLSIIAGTRISTLQNKLFHDRIVRAMPNTPGQLGKGMTVWTATEHVAAKQIKQTEAILGAMGEQLQVDEESFLDMATGLSGSSPGFVLLLIEAMIDAGVHMGFSRRDAEKMVLQTIEGTVALMRASGRHSAELKNQVTSPGGTTAAGLYELEKASIRAIINDAIFAAYRRSQELGALSEKKEAL